MSHRTPENAHASAQSHPSVHVSLRRDRAAARPGSRRCGAFGHGAVEVATDGDPLLLHRVYDGLQLRCRRERAEEILAELGAHPQTKVSATGCFSNRPSREFLVTIRTAVPVAVAHDSSAEHATARPAPAVCRQVRRDRCAVRGHMAHSRSVARSQARPAGGRLRADGRIA